MEQTPKRSLLSNLRTFFSGLKMRKMASVDAEQDAILLPLLEKYSDPQGLAKLTYVSRDIGQAVSVIQSGDDEQGALALDYLLKMASEGDELRKGLAQAWLVRARSTIDAAPTASPNPPAPNAVEAAPVPHPSLVRLRKLCARKVQP